jgi:hypothetical protein
MSLTEKELRMVAAYIVDVVDFADFSDAAYQEGFEQAETDNLLEKLVMITKLGDEE